jgi:sulfite reductase (ferredoxin)
MIKPKEPILHIPETVKEDTLAYRSKVKEFLDGKTSPIAFRAYRVPMGVYEQRTTGKFMVRIRIGAGLVLPFQLHRIAELSKKYGNGILHITTRQDIQIHEVNIEDTPDIIEGLLEVGLSSRGGGGNTVRNVTACPEAGVCPKEEFDVAPFAIATAEYLLQDRSSFNLPRKYKIAFSGCSSDCAFASVADLGFFAHKKDGLKGFSVYAAGGLGSNPAVAVKIEDFLKADEVFEVAEAIKRLFDKYGDRSNKHKARLRYVLARLGTEEFVKLYKQERETLKFEGLPDEAPQIRDIASVYPAPEGSVTVRLWLKNGDIPANGLEKVGQIAAQYGQGLVRTTQLQDLLITAVAHEDIDKVNSELKSLSIDVFAYMQTWTLSFKRFVWSDFKQIHSSQFVRRFVWYNYQNQRMS